MRQLGGVEQLECRRPPSRSGRRVPAETVLSSRVLPRPPPPRHVRGARIPERRRGGPRGGAHRAPGRRARFAAPGRRARDSSRRAPRRRRLARRVAKPGLHAPFRASRSCRARGSRDWPTGCSLAQTVKRERLGHRARARSVEDETQPAIPVRRPEDRLVKAAVRKETLTADGREPEDEVSSQDLAPLIVDGECPSARVAAPDDLTVDREVRVGREDVEIRTRAGELGERLETRRQEDVVGVQDDDELAGRSSRGCVLCGCLTTSRLPQELDPVAIGLERRGEAVRGAVVADDDLERRNRLRESRVERLTNDVGRVVGGHDHGKRWSAVTLDARRGRRSQVFPHAAPLR